jgi:hypothetical protein
MNSSHACDSINSFVSLSGGAHHGAIVNHKPPWEAPAMNFKTHTNPLDNMVYALALFVPVSLLLTATISSALVFGA